MEISFCGIKNINIKKYTLNGYGLYQNHANEICEGDKFYKIIEIDADLNNEILAGEKSDAQDFQPHLMHFLKSILKIGNKDLAMKILDYDNVNKVDLIMKRFDAPDNLGTVSQSEFILNGQKIPITSPKILPLYTFLARFTKDISELFQLTPQTKKDMKLVNKSLADCAEEFIENMGL